MTTLSPETRALIDAVGDGDRPTAEERLRLRASLVDSLGIGTAAVAGVSAAAAASKVAAGSVGASAAPLGVAASGAASTTAAGAVVATKAVVATGGLSLAVKIAGATLVASAITASAVAVSRVEPPSSMPVATIAPVTSQGLPSEVHAPVVPSTPPPVAVEALPVAEEPHVAPSPVPAVSTAVNVPASASAPSGGAHAARISSVEPAPPAEAPEPSSAASAPSSTIGEETALLRRAHGLLVAGDAAGALALLDEHARTFSNGVLVEERDAERVAALCASGQVERARTEATKFTSVHPGSALASRVRRTCEAR